MKIIHKPRYSHSNVITHYTLFVYADNGALLDEFDVDPENTIEITFSK